MNVSLHTSMLEVIDICSARRMAAVSFTLGIAVLLWGCGTMSNGRLWGEDVTFQPGWKKISESACRAATSPLVFIPAIAALLLQIDNADERLSDWAADHTPIAGSNSRAEQLSRDLRSISSYAFYLSLLATPSGNDPVIWGTSKVKGVAVQGGTALLSNQIVKTMKDAAGRQRPDKSDDKSFPSGMASSAAVFTCFTARNITAMNLSDPARTGLSAVMYTLPYAVGWERIEAREHYPSDVLAGISLSYFMGAFFHDSLMGIDCKMNGMPVVRFNGRGMSMGLCWRF